MSALRIKPLKLDKSWSDLKIEILNPLVTIQETIDRLLLALRRADKLVIATLTGNDLFAQDINFRNLAIYFCLQRLPKLNKPIPLPNNQTAAGTGTSPGRTAHAYIRTLSNWLP